MGTHGDLEIFTGNIRDPTRVWRVKEIERETNTQPDCSSELSRRRSADKQYIIAVEAVTIASGRLLRFKYSICLNAQVKVSW